MELVSFSFVFVFLPVSILLYYLTPLRWRSHCLLALSLVFCGLLSLQALGVMLALVGLQYAAVRLMHRLGPDHPARRRVCAAAVVLMVGLLVVCAALAQLGRLALPFGMLIYLLTGLGYVVDYYRGEAELEGPVEFGVMCCFFGKLYAGPLVEYGEMRLGSDRRDFSLPEVGEGILQFIQGMAKKVLLADQVSVVYAAMADIPGEELPVLGAWLMVFSAAFMTYFRLSAYCDMAMGLGRVFGLSLPRNFAYPFQSRTVSDFFARFNITVTRYIRRYVYRFLGYDTGGQLSNSMNLLLLSMLAGLWFGIRLNTLVWGMFLGIFMILEVVWGQKIFERIPPFFLRLYAFAVVLLSFSLLSANSLSESLNTVLVMTGLAGHSFTGDAAQYMLASRAVVLVACVMFATSIYSRIGRWFQEKWPNLAKFFALVFNSFLLLLTLAMMM